MPSRAFRSGLLGCSFVFAAMVLAGPCAADQRPFDSTFSERAVFSADGLEVDDNVDDVTVNTVAAIQGLGELKISNNDHFYDLEIVEAATVKPDGRRIVVPRERIFTLDGQAGGAALYLADVKTRVIPFPDLSVGDHRVVHYIKRQKLMQIPGAVFDQVVVPTGIDAPTMDLTVEVPDSLGLRVVEHDLTHKEEAIPGGKRLSWHMVPHSPHPAEPLAVSAYDRAPTIEVSNLGDWDAFGQRYGALLTHAAEPDAAVKAKAEEITKGLTDRHAIARALFEWTSSNIRYYSVFFGSGGWVPHAPGEILAQRYGDCKDHATLLRALLAAKGIESQYVLVNTNPRYKANSLPVPGFNHMIAYVPEFDRYLDPTDPTGTFDTTSDYLLDKPVLRLTATGATAARIPFAAGIATPTTVLEASVTFAADGRASGSTTIEAQGVLAEALRRVARQVSLQGGDVYARKVLSAQGWTGSGTITAPSFLDKSDSFKIEARFELDRPFFGVEDAASGIPTGPRLFERPIAMLERGLREKWQDDFACGAPRRYVEKLHLTWPAGKKLAKMPRDLDISRGAVTYRAHYLLGDDGLDIERETIFTPARAACTVADLKAASDAIYAATGDLDGRIAFAKPGQIWLISRRATAPKAQD